MKHVDSEERHMSPYKRPEPRQNLMIQTEVKNVPTRLNI